MAEQEINKSAPATVLYPKNRGVLRFWKALRFALQGLCYCYRNEAAMREYTLIFILTLPVIILLSETPNDRISLIGAGVLVIVVECLNSAIETTLDRISTEHHDLTGAAKDMGAAAVLLCALFYVYVWVEFLVRIFD